MPAAKRLISTRYRPFSRRAAWLKTRALDVADVASSDAAGAGAADIGPTLSEDELVAVAEEALQNMPEALRRLMQDVPVVVAEVPAIADVEAGLDPRSLGLFHGTPHAERGGFGEPPALTQILLFRRNLERTAGAIGSKEERAEVLRDEVRTTMLHEAGHFFGFDEDDLAGMGLG